MYLDYSISLPDILKHKNGTIVRIGRISVEKFKNSIRLGFTYNSKKYYIYYNPICHDVLYHLDFIITRLNRDLILGYFQDPTQYSIENFYNMQNTKMQNNNIEVDPVVISHSNKSQTVEKITKPTINKIFEDYKELYKHRIADTTKKVKWTLTDNALLYLFDCNSELLLYDIFINNKKQILELLLNKYSMSSIKIIFSIIQNAVKLIINEDLQLTAILSKSVKNTEVECYTVEELKIIINAVKNNKYSNNNSVYEDTHSYYYMYVRFLIETGCRPSEAIALRVNDLNIKEETVFICKSHNHGILLEHTKNYKNRKIRLNHIFLCELVKYIQDNKIRSTDILFQNRGGSYINQKDFIRRHWNVIIQGLMQDGLISRKLRCYSVRHSKATSMLNTGITINQVAKYLGDRTETIMRFYIET